jgi:8-oxo-dGTP pyrophosphatase MutT (NUDIX family)
MQVNNRVRAILLDRSERLMLIKRVKPNRTPYWVVPGGGVERHDADFEAALEREIMEELGGTIEIEKLVKVLEYHGDDDRTVRQYLYLTRLVQYDLSKRSGPEFTDPTRGEYIVEAIPMTAEAISKLNLISDEIKNFLIANLNRFDYLPDLRSALPLTG